MSAGGDEVFFKIKRGTKLSKLQGAYANKVGKDVSSIRSVVYALFERPKVEFVDVGMNAYRFLYDGNRIADDDTPASLDMEEGGMS